MMTSTPTLYTITRKPIQIRQPLPITTSSKGCRPHDADVDGFWVGMQLQMGFGAVENKRGDPWFGRPTRCVRSHNWFASLYLLPPLPTNTILTSQTHQDTHRPLMHPAAADIPRMPRQAGCRPLSLSTSLMCKSELEINFHLLHLPRIQK